MRCFETGKANGEEGSATVEATLFLTMFILFYIALMDIAQMAKLQSVLQYACVEAAKEISQGSYILTKTQIVDRMAATTGKKEEFVGEGKKVVDAFSDFSDQVLNGNPDIDALSLTLENAEEYFFNSDNLVNGIVAIVRNEGANFVKRQCVGAITKGLVKKQIKYMSPDNDPDAYLRKYGIEDGIMGLDFAGTEWIGGDTDAIQEIKIVCSYTVHYNVGFLDLGERKFTVCARTAVW